MYKIIGADKKEYGPVLASQVQAWLAEGRINGESLIRLEPGGEWRPVNSFPEFAAPPVAFAPSVAPSAPSAAPPSYLIFSILCTVCGCMPFGVVALFYSVRVGSKMASRDFAGAKKASDLAKLWCIIAVIAAIVSNVAASFFLKDIFKQLGSTGGFGTIM